MAQAVFYVNGVQQYSAKCGDTQVFDIPGYSQIWMTQYQNGVLQFDGILSLPTSPLKLTCPPDEGIFTGVAYEVINGQKGQQIASWTFQITNPASTNQPGQPPTNPTNTSGTSGCASGLCTATPNPTPPPPPIVQGVPVPVSSGGPGTTPTTTPQGGGGLNPFGGLPGEGIPVATAGTGGPGAGTSGATPSPSTMTKFNLSGFVKSPLFWLLLGLLVLVYFLGE